MMEGRGQRVVAADNDRTVLELLQIRLEVAGYFAHVARDGATALDKVRNVRPSAMILDANVDGDGYEILRTIRQRYADLHFPILMIGRDMKVEDVRKALSLGAQSCMIKPFSGADVIERVGRMLQGQNKPPPPLLQPKPATLYV